MPAASSNRRRAWRASCAPTTASASSTSAGGTRTSGKAARTAISPSGWPSSAAASRRSLPRWKALGATPSSWWSASSAVPSARTAIAAPTTATARCIGYSAAACAAPAWPASRCESRAPPCSRTATTRRSTTIAPCSAASLADCTALAHPRWRKSFPPPHPGTSRCFRLPARGRQSMAPEILAAMIGLAVLAPAVWLYDRLVADRNLVRQGFADIDVQLKRRADLVPPLVEAVRAYAAHEKAVLTSVAEVRAAAIAEPQPAQRFSHERALGES